MKRFDRSKSLNDVALSRFAGKSLTLKPNSQSEFGGDRRDRTDDLMLAKQLLSQLSYVPNFKARFSSRHLVSTCNGSLSHNPDGIMLSLRSKSQSDFEVVGLERFELSTSRLSSARSNQLSYRPITACKASKRPAEPSRHVRCHPEPVSI